VKKIFFKIIIIFSFLIIHNFTFISKNCICQWQPDVRLTYDPAKSFVADYSQSIVSSGNVLHIVWYDYRDGNIEIYYKRSSDGGVSWGVDTRLTNNIALSSNPTIATSGSLVHIVWFDSRDGNYEIYYKRSTDGGINWGEDTRLTNNTADSYYPSLATSGLFLIVVWYDSRNGNGQEIYYKCSTDGGISWGADKRFTNNVYIIERASVSVSGQIVHIAWVELRNGYYPIFYKRSIDGGNSWGIETQLENDSVDKSKPSISLSNSFVHVVWSSNRNGNSKLHYVRSTDAGLNWGENMQLTNSPKLAEHPFIFAKDAFVHIIWDDNRDVRNEVYCKRSTDNGTNWCEDIRLTDYPAHAVHPSITVSGQTVHTIWNDYRDNNWEIYYKFNPTGNTVGISNNLGLNTPSNFKLYQNYPNPFNPSTLIQYEIPKNSFVKLVVLDVLGREVETLVNEKQTAGTYEATFNASQYPSGVYFYKITTDNFSETKKMLLIK
jgi:hypothetical protein